MADEPIAAGVKVGSWLVARIEGRAATCQCRCGSLRVLVVASLVDGSAAPSCGCQPLSPGEVAQQRSEAARQRLRRDLKGWRPGA
jgi:hypothetical protein